MALKDLKSDLSKFRMPKKDPLESKERVSVNKNLNKTPLSSMVESAPKIPRSQTTTNKEGVNPKNMDNTSKFLGETTPAPSNNTSKFLGETTPTPSNNSEKFLGETTTKPLSLEERYLGETTPNSADNTSKFLGETTPTKFDNNENFLGETTPTKFDNNENFLGLTTPTLSNRESKFLGETTPNSADNTSKFLGETTPNSADNTSKFLGETTPNSADNTSKFLGETTQTPSNNTSKFLGETTPKDVNYITDIHAKGFNSKFGATLPADSKFTGVAKNQEVWNNNSIHGELKAVNFFPIETSKARGFSLNQVHRDETKFTGIKRGLNEITADDKDAFNENSSLYSKLKAVDFFPINSSKARGFSLNQFQLAPSQFIGISKDQTNWSTTSSEYSSFSKYTHVNLLTVKSFGGDPSGTKQINNRSNTYYLQPFQTGNFAVDLTKGKLLDESKWVSNLSEYSNYSSYIHPDLSSAPGYGKFKLQKQASGQKQSYNQDSTYYMDSFQRGDFALDLTKGKISKLQEMRNSPSFLDEMYSKFNLRDDAHNTGLTVFDHPLILRGIQRKGKKGNEPQNFGIPGTNIDLDDGLIRGGVITSTTRAVIDAIRLGKWMVSIKGLLWGVKQFGLQQSNPNVEKINLKRRTKIWTPINTLASSIGIQLGLHPNRHGFTPFDKGDGGYESVQKLKLDAGAFGDMGLGLFPGPAYPTDNRLVAYYGESFGINKGSKTISYNSSKTGDLSANLGWKFNNASLGGPNSVYGLIPNGKFAKREFDTRNEAIQIKKNLGDEAPGGPKHLPDDFERYFAPYTIFSQYGRKSLANGLDTAAGIVMKAPDSTNTEATDENLSPSERTQQERTEHLFFLHDRYINKDYKKDIYKFGGGGVPKSNQTDGARYIGTNAKGEDLSYARPAGEIITDYETISYINIPKRKSGAGADIDFRSLLSEDSNEYKRAEKENYGENNINKFLNFGNPGKLGENRVDWGNTDLTGDRYDKINALDIGEEPAEGTYDLIQLWFKTSDNKKIQFRGTVAGITDTFSPSWDTVKYNGRADQAYQYKTFERSLSFTFKVYATSRIEMQPIYKKLSQLAKFTMPVYGGSTGYTGQLIDFRLGSLFRERQAFIESLSYSMSDETPWDLNLDFEENPLGELPMGVDVSIGLKILGEKPSSAMKKVYDTAF